ncbi:MAG: hypothetical protein CW346_17240 [Bacillaceae bacterium]|nr:hypothetical protein [Bacillaceae bacterium]
MGNKHQNVTSTKTTIIRKEELFPDFYSCAGENYLQTLENTDFLVKSKLLCKFPFDRQHGPDDLTYGR